MIRILIKVVSIKAQVGGCKVTQQGFSLKSRVHITTITVANTRGKNLKIH
jgi:hypothetical protein